MTGFVVDRPPAGPRTVAALSVVSVLLAVATACDPYAPLPRSQTFVFPGAHAALTCVDCHLSGPPYYAFAWDTDCVDCHEPDRKLLPGETVSTHFVGLPCSTSGCHADTDLLWIDALTGGGALDHDFLPLEGAHATACAECHEGTPSSANVIPAEGTSALCWSCHEDTRYFPTHYVETESDGLPAGAELRRDCKACHDVASRTGGAFGPDWENYGYHGPGPDEIIRFPHGMENNGVPTFETSWVTACADCHPVAPPDHVCTVACHDEIFQDPVLPEHGSLTQGEDDGNCTICHVFADIRQRSDFL